MGFNYFFWGGLNSDLNYKPKNGEGEKKKVVFN